MDMNYYKKYEPIDGKWYITKELGSGAFGKVFEIERRDFTNSKSALKIISIPTTKNEVSSYREENYELDEKSISSYFYGFVEEFIKEFQLMSNLKGNSNIVSIEDYDVKEHENEIGWDILIRMELLTPMNKYFKENKPTKRAIIKLGIDICKALEICQKYNIVHRDIKPSNIFVSKTGEFKLGDFGVARTLEKTSSGLSKKGTYTYMAPEVFKGEEYNSNIDIYSLGIVMYKLLNNNFEPFRTEKTHVDEENALTRRLKGEDTIPIPANAQGRLAEIILKACSYNPKERYASPSQMRSELEEIFYSEVEGEVIYPNGDTLDYTPTDGGKSNLINDESDVTEGLFSQKTNTLDMLNDDEEKTTGLFNTINDEKEEIATTVLEENKTEKKGKFRSKSIKLIVLVAAISIVSILAGLFALNNETKAYKIIDQVVADVAIKDETAESVLVNTFEEFYKGYSDETGYYIELKISDENRKFIASYTADNIGKKMIFTINGEIIASPEITEKIDSDKIIISGNFSEKEINDIIKKLKTSNQIVEETKETSSDTIEQSDQENYNLVLSSQNIQLDVGGVFELSAENSSGTITWKSNNNSVATVKNGKVKAVGVGTATITASDSNNSVSCLVKVVKADISVESVTLSHTSLNINNGGTSKINATVSPANATNSSINWSSSNPSVATVRNGEIIAINDGTTTITATAGNKTAKCVVVVKTVWSNWVDALPGGVSGKTESKTVYRYRDTEKEYTESSSSSKSGWTKYDEDVEYGSWSSWSDNYVSETNNREVETKEVQVSAGHNEYRYGHFVGATINWCPHYGESRNGGTYTKEYSDWSTKRLKAADTHVTCGYPSSSHPRHYGVSHESGGKSWWKAYSADGVYNSGDTDYFWEETRWVEAKYKTQYRYRNIYYTYYYYRWDTGNWSNWSDNKYYSSDTREVESKKMYRYMITN